MRADVSFSFSEGYGRLELALNDVMLQPSSSAAAVGGAPFRLSFARGDAPDPRIDGHVLSVSWKDALNFHSEAEAESALRALGDRLVPAVCISQYLERAQATPYESHAELRARGFELRAIQLFNADYDSSLRPRVGISGYYVDPAAGPVEGFSQIVCVNFARPAGVRVSRPVQRLPGKQIN